MREAQTYCVRDRSGSSHAAGVGLKRIARSRVSEARPFTLEYHLYTHHFNAADV